MTTSRRGWWLSAVVAIAVAVGCDDGGESDDDSAVSDDDTTADDCVTDGYGADAWEVWRGPFGGDRKTVVVDPLDPDHVVADSCDQSGIWETRDGGVSWARANPAGAPFADSNTRLVWLHDPSYGQEWVLVSDNQSEDMGGALYRLPLADVSGTPAEALPVPLGRVQLMTVDGGARERVATLGYDTDAVETWLDGVLAFSDDGGHSWVQFNPGGMLHAMPSMAFASDGSLMVVTLLSTTFEEVVAMMADHDGSELIDALVTVYQGGEAPAWIEDYDVDLTPRFLRLEPATGTILSETELPTVPLALAAHPELHGVVWASGRGGLARSADFGVTAESVPMQLAGGSTVDSEHIVGLALTPSPRDGQETVFVSIQGGEGDERGTWRGSWSSSEATWIFERVTDGPNNEFLDFPKGPVVFAPGDREIVYGPYAEDGMLRSDAFGDPGSWVERQGGLTGYNIFGVEEDPSDPARVFATAQNVVRVSTDRVASAEWGDHFVSLDLVTANLRGGLEVDPDDPDRWLVAGGAGASGNWNGGAWLTTDGGLSWTRCIGSEGTRDNPQVHELLQHPGDPDWVLLASAEYEEEGDAGLFSSVERGEPGSFVEVLDVDDVWIVAPLPDGGVLAGGEGGLHRIVRVGDDVTAAALPWAGGVVTAATVGDGVVVVGTVGGRLLCKPLADLDAEGGWSEAADLGGTMIIDLASSDLWPGEFYAGSWGSGIWRSLDGGVSWSPFDEGLESSEASVFDLEVSACGDRLYAGTLGGMAVREL